MLLETRLDELSFRPQIMAFHSSESCSQTSALDVSASRVETHLLARLQRMADSSMSLLWMTSFTVNHRLIRRRRLPIHSVPQRIKGLPIHSILQRISRLPIHSILDPTPRTGPPTDRMSAEMGMGKFTFPRDFRSIRETTFLWPLH